MKSKLNIEITLYWNRAKLVTSITMSYIIVHVYKLEDFQSQQSFYNRKTGIEPKQCNGAELTSNQQN